MASIQFGNMPAMGDTFMLGEQIRVGVTFDEGAIAVTGTPRVALTVGSATRYATYSSLRDWETTTVVLFHYTVQAGDSDADGVSVAANALELNGGTILDADDTAADLVHAAVAGGATRKVDGGPVTVTYAADLAEADANDGSVTGSVTATLAGDTFTSDVVSGKPREREQRAGGPDGELRAHERHGGHPDADGQRGQPREQRQHRQPGDRLHRRRLRHGDGGDGRGRLEVGHRGHLPRPVDGDLVGGASPRPRPTTVR